MIEKSQRQADREGLQPQRELRQFDGKRIAIHTVEAMDADQPSAQRQSP